ncbi:MAG: DUF2325 domain-containing protein [Defluviitaleaceae bacterium]|nr:DUF2325 domain-containing protein [Defluviitaleaceae bacterium]
MNVVIVGGNERMTCRYKDICKNHGCVAKVFTKEKGMLRKKIGCPDFMVLFVGTVSHKMAISAVEEAKAKEIPIVRVHSSSVSALNQALENYASA